MGKTLTIKLDDQQLQEKGVVRYRLSDGDKHEVLWFRCDERYDPYIARDRCDCAVMALLVSAMKAGYERVESDLMMSQKLYYDLTYHVIPQLYEASRKKHPQIEIGAPLTKEAPRGEKVCAGMSCGVDSFATLLEYGMDFGVEEYRINALTFYRAGTHGHSDEVREKVRRLLEEAAAKKGALSGANAVGAGQTSAVSADEKYEYQLACARAFCEERGYELIVAESNLDDILVDWFEDVRFARTRTVREVAMTLFLQGLIRAYYCPSSYNVTDFKLSPAVDMARYERWLLPLVGTEGTSFYQSGQNWTSLEKVERLVGFDECHGYLRVCAKQGGNCLRCRKCRLVLMQLDVLGDDALDKFANSFDVEGYRQSCRKRWFRKIFALKDGDGPDAGDYDELFMYAVEHRPELIGNIVRTRQEGVDTVVTRMHGVVRECPSRLSKAVAEYEPNQKYPYLGESGVWVAIELSDGSRGFMMAKKVSLQR